MPNTSSYQIQEETPPIVSEPAVAYQRTAPSHVSSNALNVMEMEFSDRINPNVPFHGTQEEWWEHFRCIEESEFETWEEHQKIFNEWKTKLLSSHM